MAANIFQFPQAGDGIAPGGGGPHDPGMENRVARLEALFTRIETLLLSVADRVGQIDEKIGKMDDRLRRLEIDAAELKGRVNNLPSTWAMITTIVGTAIALSGFFVAASRYGGVH